MTPNPHIKQLVSCAAPGCGKIRGESNFWYVIIEGEYFDTANGIHISGLILCPINATLLSLDNARPVCGESCAVKIVSQYMSASAEKERSQKEIH